jgi:hypothetical protein
LNEHVLFGLDAKFRELDFDSVIFVFQVVKLCVFKIDDLLRLCVAILEALVFLVQVLLAAQLAALVVDFTL